MKKSALFISLLASSVCFAGCDVDLGFFKTGNTQKEEKKDSDVNPDSETYVDPSEKDSEQSEDSASPGSEVSFDYMKEYVINVVKEFYGIEESEIIYGTYGVETDQFPDINLYNTAELMFVDANLFYDEEYSVVIEELKSYLPSDAAYQEDMSSLSEDDGLYDLWYKSGAYYFAIYVDDWYGWATFDIVPQSQSEAYIDLVYDDEDDDDWDWDDDDDWDWDDDSDWDF